MIPIDQTRNAITGKTLVQNAAGHASALGIRIPPTIKLLDKPNVTRLMSLVFAAPGWDAKFAPHTIDVVGSLVVIVGNLLEGDIAAIHIHRPLPPLRLLGFRSRQA